MRMYKDLFKKAAKFVLFFIICFVTFLIFNFFIMVILQYLNSKYFNRAISPSNILIYSGTLIGFFLTIISLLFTAYYTQKINQKNITANLLYNGCVLIIKKIKNKYEKISSKKKTLSLLLAYECYAKNFIKQINDDNNLKEFEPLFDKTRDLLNNYFSFKKSSADLIKHYALILGKQNIEMLELLLMLYDSIFLRLYSCTFNALKSLRNKKYIETRSRLKIIIYWLVNLCALNSAIFTESADIYSSLNKQSIIEITKNLDSKRFVIEKLEDFGLDNHRHPLIWSHYFECKIEDYFYEHINEF